MSNNNKDEDFGIRYLVNDTEFVLNSSKLNSECINDIIYTDGNQTYVLNGHFLQETEDVSNLILKEEEVSQYLINDDKGELLLADIQNGAVDQTQENQHIQYVSEDGKVIEEPEVLYINEDDIPLIQDNSSQYQLTELMDTENPLADNDEEQTTVIDLESFIQNQGGEAPILELTATDWYQYAVVKDNQLHYAVPNFVPNEDATPNSGNNITDVSTITGKNLITGQVVTLENYMDRIHKKMKSLPTDALHWKKPKHNLNAFLNRKFNLGLKVGGKRLVGKIVHVGNKDGSDNTHDQEGEIENEECNNENSKLIYTDGKKNSGMPNSKLKKSTINGFHQEKQHRFQTKLLSKKSDQFQQISKTLSGLMNIENVSAQLVKKSIQIKIIDKYFDNAKKINKNISFISGYMESKVVSNDENELVEEWTFVPDTLKTEYFRSSVERKSQIKYADTVDLTISTTHQNNKSIVKVILDSKAHSCNSCDKTLDTKENLILHLNEEHNQCELCKLTLDDISSLLQHKKIHVQSGELKTCKIDSCKNYFQSESALKKHVLSHKLETLKCPVCPYSSTNDADINLHLATHANSISKERGLNVQRKNCRPNELSVLKKIQTKYYACDICQRTFSRQSNLQRHADIHKGAEKLYRCASCGCSYHYISSLTRHIVQNHVQLRRPNFTLSTNGNEIEI